MKQAISSSSRTVVKQVVGGRSTLNLVNTPHNFTSVVNFSKSSRVLNQQKPKAPESVKYNKDEQLKSVASNTKGGQESKSGTSLLFKFLVSGMVISAGALGVLMYLRDDIEKLRTLEKQVVEQQEILNQYKSGSSSTSSPQQDTEKDREEKVRQFSKKASSETSALESQLEIDLKQIQSKLNSIQGQLSSIQNEKSTISQNISSLQASQESIQQELTKLQNEKKDLLQAIDNFAKHTSTQVDVSTLKSNEGPVGVEEREQFVIRIQQVEMQLAAKEKLLTQVQQDYDGKVLKIQTLTEQETKLEVEKMSTQLSAKQTELELLKEKLQRELNDEKIKLQEDMTKSLKEQATEVGSIYATHLAKKDQQLKQVEEHLQKLEQTFNSSIGYINDSLKIQEYTTAIISLKDAAENKKQGFKKELEKLRQISMDDDLVQTTLSLINDNTATKGACTLEELRDRFATVKKKALTSSLAPPKAGFFGFVYSKIASVFVFEEEGLAEGDSVNASLSRAEYYLKHRRLEEALVEIVKVCETKDNSDLSFVLGDWMKEAADRVVIDQTIRSLQSHLLILSQSVQ